LCHLILSPIRNGNRLEYGARRANGVRTMGRGTREEPVDGEDGASSVATLKTEVLKTIARALESKAGNPTGVLDFDEKRGVKFYEEVTKFEIELIRQALFYTGGNKRAAARLLGLKTSTLNSKVKTYNIDLTRTDDELTTGDPGNQTNQHEQS
jgi:DNA-binding protein Fis